MTYASPRGHEAAAAARAFHLAGDFRFFVVSVADWTTGVGLGLLALTAVLYLLVGTRGTLGPAPCGT